MKLPQNFTNRMGEILHDELPQFVNSLQSDNFTGLRLNTLKTNDPSILQQFNITSIPWCNTGYYYQDSYPGKHPYHNAGLYYIQEPSAMSVVELSNIQPHDLVCDLCASPGGKSTQIACKLNGTGLLVANEIHPTRAKILSQNIERMGITNAIVTNETPERLANHFGAIFDKVIVDAPCSGEGMFRKNNDAIDEWSIDNTIMCHNRQLEILDQADKLLKPNGTLTYSTCTFAPIENEGTIDKFLQTHPNYKVCKINHTFDNGNCKYINSDNTELNNCVRIFPHHTKGEGHFVAVLQKIDGEYADIKLNKSRPNNKMIALFNEWQNKYLITPINGKFVQFGDTLYLAPNINLDISNLKVLRHGLQLGIVLKNIFEPSHSLAMALNINNFNNIVNLNYNQAVAYLRGNTINTTNENGWCLVCIDNFPLGFGKINNDIMKNHYPKGLRI